MANEKPDVPKGKPAPFLVIGLSLLTIGIILPSNNGPLQIAILLAAVGMLFYAVVLSRKARKQSSDKT